MILIKADEDTEAGVLPSQQLLTEMGAYKEQLVNAGVMVAGEGLHASSRGVVERYPYPRDRDAQYEIEIRPVFGAEDFGDVMTPGSASRRNVSAREPPNSTWPQRIRRRKRHVHTALFVL